MLLMSLSLHIPSISHEKKHRVFPAAKIYPSIIQWIDSNINIEKNSILIFLFFGNEDLLYDLLRISMKRMKPINPVIDKIASHEEPGSITPFLLILSPLFGLIAEKPTPYIGDDTNSLILYENFSLRESNNSLSPL